MGRLQITEQIKQGLGCGEHVAHAEFAVLTSNFGGQFTRGGGVARDITTVGQSQDGIGKLAAQAFFRTRLIDYSIGRSHGLLRGLRQGKGPFPAL